LDTTIDYVTSGADEI